MWRPWGSKPETFNFNSCAERLQEVICLIQIIRNVRYCGNILEFKNVVNDLFFKYFDVNN